METDQRTNRRVKPLCSANSPEAKCLVATNYNQMFLVLLVHNKGVSWEQKFYASFLQNPLDCYNSKEIIFQ